MNQIIDLISDLLLLARSPEGQKLIETIIGLVKATKAEQAASGK